MSLLFAYIFKILDILKNETKTYEPLKNYLCLIIAQKWVFLKEVKTTQHTIRLDFVAMKSLQSNVFQLCYWIKLTAG